MRLMKLLASLNPFSSTKRRRHRHHSRRYRNKHRTRRHFMRGG